MVVSNIKKACYICEKSGFTPTLVKDFRNMRSFIFEFPNEEECFNARAEIESINKEEFNNYVNNLDICVLSKLREMRTEAVRRDRNNE